MEYRNKIYVSYRYTLPINWWKIQQNLPGRLLEIPVFLGDYFIMPHPVDISWTPFNTQQALAKNRPIVFLHVSICTSCDAVDKPVSF